MLLVSHFTPDPDRMGQFLAVLWQGPPPTGIALRSWLYLDTDPRTMLLVWEADTEEVWADMEGIFGEGGTLRTVTASDATGGLDAAWQRDLPGFGDFLRSRDTPEDQIEPQLALRRLGLDAATRDEARRAAQEWVAGRG